MRLALRELLVVTSAGQKQAADRDGEMRSLTEQNNMAKYCSQMTRADRQLLNTVYFYERFLPSLVAMQTIDRLCNVSIANYYYVVMCK